MGGQGCIAERVIEAGGQAVEVVRPEAAVRCEPRVGVAHRRRDEPHPADATLTPPLDEARALRGERHRERARDLADGRLAQGEAGDDRAARRVGEGAEDGVERPAVGYL